MIKMNGVKKGLASNASFSRTWKFNISDMAAADVKSIDLHTVYQQSSARKVLLLHDLDISITPSLQLQQSANKKGTAQYRTCVGGKTECLTSG